MKDRYRTARHVLCSYFHQDWRYEGADGDDVLRKALSELKHRDLTLFRSDLSELLATHEDADIEAWLDEIGCAYVPESEGRSATQWLSAIVGRIGEVLEG